MKRPTLLVKYLAAADFLLGAPVLLAVLFLRGPRAYAQALREAGDKVDRALTKHTLL